MSVPLPVPCLAGDRGAALLAIRPVFEAIAIILVGLRVYTRVRLVPGGLGWDDATVIVAMLLLIPGYALTIKMVQYGLGRHIGCISVTDLIHVSKFIIVGEVLLVFSTLFSRVSICLFLLRIFTVNKSWRWTLYAIIGLTTTLNVILAATNLSQCKPRAKLWNPLLPGTCWNHEVILGIAYFQGGVSVILDLLLSAFPIYCLRNIQMSLRIKAAICGIMSLGVVTAIACLIRTIFSDRIISKDFTWAIVVPTIWGHLEGEIAICAACIATLRPLFTRDPLNSKRNSKRSTYTQFSSKDRSLVKWPGARAREVDDSHSATVTSAPGPDEDVSLEKLYPIKKATDGDEVV